LRHVINYGEFAAVWVIGVDERWFNIQSFWGKGPLFVLYSTFFDMFYRHVDRGCIFLTRAFKPNKPAPYALFC